MFPYFVTISVSHRPPSLSAIVVLCPRMSPRKWVFSLLAKTSRVPSTIPQQLSTMKNDDRASRVSATSVGECGEGERAQGREGGRRARVAGCQGGRSVSRGGDPNSNVDGAMSRESERERERERDESARDAISNLSESHNFHRGTFKIAIRKSVQCPVWQCSAVQCSAARRGHHRPMERLFLPRGARLNFPVLAPSFLEGRPPLTTTTTTSHASNRRNIDHIQKMTSSLPPSLPPSPARRQQSCSPHSRGRTTTTSEEGESAHHRRRRRRHVLTQMRQ